jgi:hypothetical protein
MLFETYRSKIGPLPEDALFDEVLHQPDITGNISSDMRKWLEDLVKRMGRARRRLPPPG